MSSAIDGDHFNNDPGNLALVEAVDHLRLHGMFGLVRPGIRLAAVKGGKARMAKLTPAERSKHCRMMVMTKVKKERLRRKAANAERA